MCFAVYCNHSWLLFCLWLLTASTYILTSWTQHRIAFKSSNNANYNQKQFTNSCTRIWMGDLCLDRRHWAKCSSRLKVPHLKNDKMYCNRHNYVHASLQICIWNCKVWSFVCTGRLQLWTNHMLEYEFHYSNTEGEYCNKSLLKIWEKVQSQILKNALCQKA